MVMSKDLGTYLSAHHWAQRGRKRRYTLVGCACAPIRVLMNLGECVCVCVPNEGEYAEIRNGRRFCLIPCPSAGHMQAVSSPVLLHCTCRQATVHKQSCWGRRVGCKGVGAHTCHYATSHLMCTSAAHATGVPPHYATAPECTAASSHLWPGPRSIHLTDLSPKTSRMHS